MTTDCAPAELQAVYLSRDLEDGELGAAGASAAIPMAAILLARLTHAPNIQIAGEMFLAEKTVKNYVSHLLAKLGMERRSEAAAYAARLAERRRDR